EIEPLIRSYLQANGHLTTALNFLNFRHTPDSFDPIFVKSVGHQCSAGRIHGRKATREIFIQDSLGVHNHPNPENPGNKRKDHQQGADFVSPQIRPYFLPARTEHKAPRFQLSPLIIKQERWPAQTRKIEPEYD